MRNGMHEADEVPGGTSPAYALSVVKKSRGLWEHRVGITDQFASQERLSGGGDI